ncbi:RNA polymerase subunit sigma-70, partial [Mycolicibacterium elephantis]
MARVKSAASTGLRATLIGDVVGSRGAADRAAVHRALDNALADAVVDA